MGPYPVYLSEIMMRSWLTSEQFERVRGVWHVSIGRRMILEAMEQRVRELPETQRNMRWAAMWLACSDIGFPLLPHDRRTHEELQKAFKAGTVMAWGETS